LFGKLRTAEEVKSIFAQLCAMGIENFSAQIKEFDQWLKVEYMGLNELDLFRTAGYRQEALSALYDTGTVTEGSHERLWLIADILHSLGQTRDAFDFGRQALLAGRGAVQKNYEVAELFDDFPELFGSRALVLAPKYNTISELLSWSESEVYRLGWSLGENHSWSYRSTAVLPLKLYRKISQVERIVIEFGLPPKSDPEPTHISFKINGRTLGGVTLESSASSSTQRFEIFPTDFVGLRANLTFCFHDAAPLRDENGMVIDERRLGIALFRMKLLKRGPK